MSASGVSYRMNPAEDILLPGDEIAEGMWVLIEDLALRPGGEADEETQLRAQRFRKVTRLRRHGEQVRFTGVWVDGYQQSQGAHIHYHWIVKKSSLPEPPEPDDIACGQADETGEDETR